MEEFDNCPQCYQFQQLCGRHSFTTEKKIVYKKGLETGFIIGFRKGLSLSGSTLSISDEYILRIFDEYLISVGEKR